ncbi:MAG TPA: sigma-70 family RNA polymerase sigma factor [Ktedonobacteraceae bacterium]|nr:sigma-70 family RNA polymerase sigma factor [Ktedonobacteraceae bacterium]
MSSEFMLTCEVLDQMDDLSSRTLYRAEVQQIPFLSRREQPEVVEAARSGDETASHRLLTNCLNWTMRRAAVTYRTAEPAHLEMMDLVGQANMKMVEAMPNALAAENPVGYLMAVSAREMQRYCTYHDPLITRSKDRPLTDVHPSTVSLDAGEVPLLHTLASGEVVTTNTPEYEIVYAALRQLGSRHRAVLEAAFGLDGQPKRKNQDIADELGLPKETIEKYLWRAKKRLARKLAPHIGQLTMAGTT